MNKRILLVEDNPISREFMHEALRPLGLPIDLAETLAAAVTLARRHEHAIFLCDVHLPDGEPQDIFKALRRQQHHTSAIAITAHADVDARRALLETGYREVWLKPISIAALQDNVSYLLGIFPAAPVGASNAELWDEATALRAVGNNQTTLLALRNMFLVELPVQIKMIEQAHENKNFAMLKTECHKLVASCGFVGAVGLGQAIRGISDDPGSHEKMMIVRRHAAKHLQAG